MIQWDDIKERVGKWNSLKKLFDAGGPQAQMLGACVAGNAEYARQLLAEDSSLASTPVGDFGPLRLAAHFGNRAVAEVLVDGGADVNALAASGFQDSPVHVAAGRGHADVVALLIERGADANSLDVNGETAVHKAAKNNHVQVVRVLTQAGADLEIRGRQFSGTVLQTAIDVGHVEVVEELVNAGADVNANPADAVWLFFSVKNQHEWPVFDPLEGVRPLYGAVCRGLPLIVELLLDHGADINALSFGWSALHASVLSLDKEMVDLLLRRGADPHVKSDVRSPLGEEYNHRTPLELLAGFRRCAELLLSATQ